MPHPTRPTSVADLHDIYGGLRQAKAGARERPSGDYRRTDYFLRDRGHPGSPPRQPPNARTKR